MLQTDLNPTTQQRAAEVLVGLWLGYWKVNEENNSKVHILTQHDHGPSPICNCWHPRYLQDVDSNVQVWKIECGNCKRIYLSLVRKCLTGK